MSTPFHNADGTPMTPEQTRAALVERLERTIGSTLAVLLQTITDPNPGWFVRSGHGLIITYDVHPETGKPTNARPSSVAHAQQLVSEDVAKVLATHTHDATGKPMEAVRADRAAVEELGRLANLLETARDDTGASVAIAARVQEAVAAYEARQQQQPEAERVNGKA